MSEPNPVPCHDGGCTCRHVRYRMTSSPMFVHCCHCRWCQRETGTAFALNALIEADRVQLLHGDVEVIDTPSNSGKGQKIRMKPSSLRPSGLSNADRRRERRKAAIPRPPF